MKVLLIGGGGREHALTWKLAQSPLLDRLYCAPGNAGIAQIAECIALDIADHAAVIRFCKEQEIGLVVNNARDASEAQLVFAQLEVAASRFLNRRLTYFGFIAHDPSVRDAVLVQRPIVDHLPQSPASRCFRILASRLSGMVPQGGSGLRLVTPLACPAPTSPETPQCA